MGAEFYTVGKGVLSICEYTATPAVWTPLGNATNVQIEMVETPLEHFESKTARAAQDEEIVIRSGYNLSFTLDEVSKENLKIFVKATESNGVLQANTNLSQKYALKFVSANVNGPNRTWEFHKCKVTPNGAYSLISDEWTTLQFTAKGLADYTGHASSPFFSVTGTTTA